MERIKILVVSDLCLIMKTDKKIFRWKFYEKVCQEYDVPEKKEEGFFQVSFNAIKKPFEESKKDYSAVNNVSKIFIDFKGEIYIIPF